MRAPAKLIHTALAAAALLLCGTGCPKDEFDPNTWIEKLDDPSEAKEALTKLEQLKDPRAIAPLVKFWEKKRYPSMVLGMIINLAKHVEHDVMVNGTKIDERATEDRIKKIQADLRDLENMERDIASAAADRKGEMQDKIEFARRAYKLGDLKPPFEITSKVTLGPTWDPALPALVEALRHVDMDDPQSREDASRAAEALGNAIEAGASSSEAADVLIDVAKMPLAKSDPGMRVRIAAATAMGKFGPNPRTVPVLIDLLSADIAVQHIKVNAAAANALADAHDPSAIDALLEAIFKLPVIHQQCRTALTSIGRPVVPELIKVMRGQHAGLNQFAKENNFANDCAAGEGPGTTCVAPGALEYKAAILLGDFRAREAVPLLINLLEQPAKAATYTEAGTAGTTTHAGALDALRNIADPAAADAVYNYWTSNAEAPASLQALAMDVYSMLVRETRGLSALSKIFSDESVDFNKRLAAALAYSRLARDAKHLAPLKSQLAKFKAHADKQAAAADKETDPDEKRAREQARDDARNDERTFEEFVWRAEVGAECGDDVACYAKYLDADDLMVGKPGLAKAERALIELTKLGPKAASVLDKLLEHAGSSERIVRQGVLLALPRVAELPCPTCTAALDKVLNAQRDQTTLDYLNAETRIVMYYFRNAGTAAAPNP